MAEDGRPVWVYGINSVLSLIESHWQGVIEVCTAQNSNNSRLSLILQAAKSKGIPCSVKPVQAFERTVGELGHQGVMSLCRLPAYLGERDLKALCGERAIFLILDQVTDPVNFGSCLRNAEAFGVTAAIVPSNNTAQLTPTAIKVASGAVGRVPIVQAANLSRAILLLKKLGVWIVGTVVGSGQHLSEIDCRRSVAFVMGAEGSGLRKRTSSLCDHWATIPLSGKIGSLNVSVASAICLYEMKRQRIDE